MTCRVIVFTLSQYLTAQTRNSPKFTHCYNCGVKFKKPSKLKPYEVFTHRAGVITKRYHVDCAKLKNLL